MCNVFVEHFDQLILDYSTPHWFVYVYLQSNEVLHTHGRREGGRESALCYLQKHNVKSIFKEI